MYDMVRVWHMGNETPLEGIRSTHPQKFAAEILVENKRILRLLENMGFDIEKRRAGSAYDVRLTFRGKQGR